MRVKLFFSCLAIVALLITSLLNPVGHAQEVSREVPTSGTKSAWEEVGFGSIETNITPQSLQLIQKGTSRITNRGAGEVTGIATTETKSSVRNVGVSIAIEQYNNGSWTFYQSLGSASSTNTSTVSHNATIIVPGGYNYRVKATHWASSGSTYEEATSVTAHIYVE